MCVYATKISFCGNNEKLKKNIEHESDDDTNCNWCAQYSHQWIDKGAGGL